MSSVLLTRESAFQISCANTLFQAGIARTVVVEAGASMPGEWLTLRDLAWRLKVAWNSMRTAPPRACLGRGIAHLANLLSHRRYYGHRAFHRRRLLHNGQVFDPGLTVIRVCDINAPDALEAVQRAKPKLVFVYGTRLIRRAMREHVPVPFVNLHWGWSPDYRAEGIVSALAREGPRALGVTVHLLDDGIDSGNILYQARPTVDPLDNFYSLGLKLTRLGTELFLRVADAYTRQGRLMGVKQTLHPSQLFSGDYLRNHPEFYPLAWRNLKDGYG